MYELAKKARDERKAKARRLAAAGTLDKDQDTTTATWSPAEPLDADVKTGARPVGKGARLYNKGGKVSGGSSAGRADRKRRATGGRALEKEIGNAMANKDVRAANEERDGKKHIGAFKKGGGIKDAGILDKKAVGDVQVKPVRGKAENYKKGGVVKKAAGGRKDYDYVGASSVTEGGKPVMRPSDIQDKRQREPEASDLYSGEQLKRLERGYKKGGDAKKRKIGKDSGGGIDRDSISRMQQAAGSLPSSSFKNVPQPRRLFGEEADAARGPGKGSLYKKGGRAERKAGGRAKAKPSIVVKIETGKAQAPAMGGLGAVPPVPPVPPMPPVPPAAGAPMGPGPVPPIPGMGAGPIGRKAGGRITKIAKSYKDMEAGAASGEGRLQKTDIEKRHTDAPARKDGGRISKVAKSYKDMTAGAGDGEGRLQKTDIAKAKKARGK